MVAPNNLWVSLLAEMIVRSTKGTGSPPYYKPTPRSPHSPLIFTPFSPSDKTWAPSLSRRLALSARGGYDRPLQSVGHRHERDSPSPAVVLPKAWLRMKAGPTDTEDSDAVLAYQDCISRTAACVPAAQPKQALNCPNNNYSGECTEIQETS